MLCSLMGYMYIFLKSYKKKEKISKNCEINYFKCEETIKLKYYIPLLSQK